MLQKFLALRAMKGGSGSGGGSASKEWFNDGNTHIWISLAEGRTSPMLGVRLNGTATVDWGDGSEPDVLTGTDTANTQTQWTPTHNYAKSGDYIITLAVDGEMMFYGDDYSDQYSGVLRYINALDTRNSAYRNAVRKVEVGNNVVYIGSCAFNRCYGLQSVRISDSVKEISDKAFSYCYSLLSVYIPENVTTVQARAFQNCTSIASVNIPSGVTTINANTFYCCYGIACVDFTTHTAVPTLSNTSAFSNTATDLKILVPSALYDEWISATNWATYADKIVAV